MKKLNLLLYIMIVMALLPLKSAFAYDDLMKSVEIAGAGMQVQSDRLRIAAQNIANADSTGITPGSDPYRRKTIYFKSVKDKKLGTEKVAVRKYGYDQSDFRMVYDPHHPAANAQGYVAYPNVDKMIENMDAKEAQRSYEANISVIDMSKTMMSNTIAIIK